MRGLLDENKKIVFRYRGTGKFAVRKAQRQAEAKERQARFDELTNTSIKIQEYIESRLNTDEQVGTKVEKKLVARGMKMINKKYGIKRKK